MAEQQQQQQQQRKYKAPYALTCFEKYRDFELLNESELDIVINYICGHLNGDYTFNYPYWYDMYNYTTKSKIVLRHRKEKGNYYPLVKLGECVCQNKVINFLKNPDKKCNCSDGCASVYFKKVFKFIFRIIIVKKKIKNMNKMDVIVFASICAFSFCYILFFDNKNNSRKKIDKEIDETIKKISETSVVFK